MSLRFFSCAATNFQTQETRWFSNNSNCSYRYVQPIFFSCHSVMPARLCGMSLLPSFGIFPLPRYSSTIWHRCFIHWLPVHSARVGYFFQIFPNFSEFFRIFLNFSEFFIFTIWWPISVPKPAARWHMTAEWARKPTRFALYCTARLFGIMIFIVCTPSACIPLVFIIFPQIFFGRANKRPNLFTVPT